MTLDDLSIGQSARITNIRTADERLEVKLRETGFAENDEVEILQRGFLGRQPLCVRLNQTLIALRRNEAMAIEIALPGAGAAE